MHVIEAKAPSAGLAVKGRVLGVDDDAVARFFLEQGLTDAGFTAEVACSADEAEEILRANPPGTFECVVTDHQMPGRTGLELLAFLARFDDSIASIMIAGAGEKNLVAQTLRSGAIDYLDKPYSQDALESAVGKAVHLTRRRRDIAQNEAETAAVGEIQRHLQTGRSGELPGGVRFCHLPMRSAGGDFLNVFETPQRQLLVLGVDVSGHDLRSAFVSAYFQGIVRGMVEKGTEIGEILAFFNRCLLADWMDLKGTSVHLPTSLALTAALIEPDGRTCRLFGGGAPDAHIVDTNRAVLPGGVGGGSPIGWFPDDLPVPVETPLPDHGWIVMWTDGLEEHAGHLGANPWSLAFASLDQAAGTRATPAVKSATDDILVTAVPVGGASLADGFPIFAERYSGARFVEIDHIQNTWQRSLTLAVPGLGSDRHLEIILCLREGLLNALVHGCGGEEERFASLQIHYIASEKVLLVIIEDPGDGHEFAWAEHGERAAEELIEEHRGLLLIHEFADRVHTDRRGARIVLEFHCPEIP